MRLNSCATENRLSSKVALYRFAIGFSPVGRLKTGHPVIVVFKLVILSGEEQRKWNVFACQDIGIEQLEQDTNDALLATQKQFEDASEKSGGGLN